MTPEDIKASLDELALGVVDGDPYVRCTKCDAAMVLTFDEDIEFDANSFLMAMTVDIAEFQRDHGCEEKPEPHLRLVP